MKFYNALNLLYLETDTYGISLGAGLLQVKYGINCGQEEVPKNTAMCTIAFVSMSLFSAEQQESNIE